MVAVRWFHWLSAGPIPAAQDLRRLGWELCVDRPGRPPCCHCVALANPARLSTAAWVALVAAPLGRRAATLAIGIDQTTRRERLLRLGFGDALPAGVSLGELEMRALRVAELAEAVPRQRQAGPLLLDLLTRDARVAGRRVGLHPREFALLWRLAEAAGTELSADRLLRDVWQLAFKPETNSLAVHVSRLRAKLRIAGADRLIETTPGGGYRLARAPEPASDETFFPRRAELALDAHVRLREESATTEQEANHEA